MNADKDLRQFYSGEPPGLRTNALRWLQKRVMAQARALPRQFETRAAWEAFRDQKIRRELPVRVGIPPLPPLQPGTVRARVRVGEDAVCERIDVYMDDDYAMPALLFLPAEPPASALCGLVLSPGWLEDKWGRPYQAMGVRLARQGFAVLVIDHAPFGETTANQFEIQVQANMTLLTGMGDLLGISQLALRVAETQRAGEYLRARPDVDPARVAVSGLCQGGEDTWFAAALDEGFCAAAPFCSATTFGAMTAEMASYHAYSDATPFPFGILSVCDADHLHAAIAPRPLLVRANLGDRWWPVSGFDEIEAFTRRIYRLYDAEDRVDFRAEVHEHALTGPFADALERFVLDYV